MATEKRITTNVVAYTSFRLGHVTRPISLRTSARNRRERPHHPVTLSRARPPRDSCSSTVAAFIVFGARGRSLKEPTPSDRPCLPAQPGRTGGNRTPNPRFWRPVLCQLSYCPSYSTEGLRPRISLLDHVRSRSAISIAIRQFRSPFGNQIAIRQSNQHSSI